MTETFVVYDADSGRLLAGARDAIAAEEKAQALEAEGRRVGIRPGPSVPEEAALAAYKAASGDPEPTPDPEPPAPGPEPEDVPEGYRRLEPRLLATSTRRRDADRWRREAEGFPEDWGRWGEGHTTANVAYACFNRGLVEIAVPISGRGPYLYRQKVAR